MTDFAISPLICTFICILSIFSTIWLQILTFLLEENTILAQGEKISILLNHRLGCIKRAPLG
jgi:hypothetical protein